LTRSRPYKKGKAGWPLGLPPQGARAGGSKAAPLLVLPCYLRPQNIPTINQNELSHLG
jgi:hypothetical protein